MQLHIKSVEANCKANHSVKLFFSLKDAWQLFGKRMAIVVQLVEPNEKANCDLSDQFCLEDAWQCRGNCMHFHGNYVELNGKTNNNCMTAEWHLRQAQRRN